MLRDLLLHPVFPVRPDKLSRHWLWYPEQHSALMRKIIDRVRNSLELRVVLQTAVDEIAALLDLDRCTFFWYFQDTRRVQVVCERIVDRNSPDSTEQESPGQKRPSILGYYPLERFGSIGDAIARGEVVVNTGMVQSPAIVQPIAGWFARLRGEETAHSQEVLGARATLIVPIKVNATSIGFIACLSDNPRQWTAIEVEFIRSFAQQLEIAISQAQLYEQTQKQAQRERLVNQITTQTRQSFDLDLILSEAIAQLLDALEIDRCLLHLIDEWEDPRAARQSNESYRLASNSRVTLRRKNLFEVCRDPFEPSIEYFDPKGPITQWVVKHQKRVVISDVTQDDRIGSNNQEYQQAQIRSSLVVPVQAQGTLYAIIYLNQCSHVRYWSKNDQKLAQAVADQLAISIRQAHLYAQAHQQMERESLLRLISDQIRGTLDLKTILQTVVREVRQLLDADRVVIYQFVSGGEGGFVVEETIPEWNSIVTEARQADFARKYANLYAEGWVRATADIYNGTLDKSYIEFLEQLQVRANLIVPILREGAVSESDSLVDAETLSHLWGLLIVHECKAPRQWRASEIDLLKQLAAQMSIAIQQAELYAQMQKKATESAAQAKHLAETLYELRLTQSQLIQSEKMSSLGRLVAGLAHEINNPVNFIYGNIPYIDSYVSGLLRLLHGYQTHYPQVSPELEQLNQDVELDFLMNDLPRILKSMRTGTERIREIVLSLRNFSRLDEAQRKSADIHEGLESTLFILQNQLKEIHVVRDFSDLPSVECYPSLLNQVFMNLLMNAIEALHGYAIFPKVITIRTELVRENSTGNTIRITIADNGPGIAPEIQSKIFDPFFTTKEVGQGTGLGLTVSYQMIVNQHGGQLRCASLPGQGAEFTIDLPVEIPSLPVSYASLEPLPIR